MRIAVDAMGGDHAPAHPVDGAVGGREGLLPDEGEAGVGEDDEPRGDQHDRDDSEYPVHRRDSRSGA